VEEDVLLPCYRIVGSSFGRFTLALDLFHFFLDFEQAHLDHLISLLGEDGYDTYLASVGGSGLGILSPYNRNAESHLDDGPVTPPETPALGGSPGDDDGVRLYRSQRAAFESKSPAELVEWMESRGRWLYV
jgi:hypothetical protein